MRRGCDSRSPKGMIIKEVTQVGNSIIRTKAKKAPSFASKKVRKVITDLVDSMRHYNLVGMAAPQIGQSVRIFVSEIRKTKFRKNTKDTDPVRIYINPEIIWRSKKQAVAYEGCGSVAFSNLFGAVKRPASVIVQAHDRKGKTFTLKANGLLARVIQHEYDHLDGIVFTDKADPKSFMSRNEYLGRSKK